MKVSVIIPTYNGEKTIERAILSVLNQTLKCEKEILICDDCSTDRTVEIALKHDCKIYRNQTNSGGPNLGRNTGIKKSSGDYVCFLDQDDEWLLNKLETQFKHIENGADFVYSPSIKKQE